MHTNSRTSSRISHNAAAGDARSLSRDGKVAHDKDGDRDGDSDSGDDDDGKVASGASGKVASGEVASGASGASGSSPRQKRAGRHATGASPPAKKPKKSLTALQSAIEVATTEDRAGTFRVLGEAVAQLGEATVVAQKQIGRKNAPNEMCRNRGKSRSNLQKW